MEDDEEEDQIGPHPDVDTTVIFTNRPGKGESSSSLAALMICSSFMVGSASRDEVAEWLRRWTANPLCSARVGSNPILVEFFSFFCQSQNYSH